MHNCAVKTVVLLSAAAFFILLCQRFALAEDTMKTPDKELKRRARLEAILPEFQKYAEETLKKSGVPGIAIAIVQDDRTAYLKGFGVRKAGEPAEVGPDTVFQLASMSKPFTSGLIASLVGEGLLAWDDKVTDTLPGFKLYDPAVTSQFSIRDLLAQRSGLPEYTGDDLAFTFMYGLPEIIARIRWQQPVEPFRSSYGYQNVMFAIAGEAAAVKTGKTYASLMRERIFSPLGMASTSAVFADFEKAENKAFSHRMNNGKPEVQEPAKDDIFAPAGGICSTARDLARWLRFQLAGGSFDGKQLVPKAALEETGRAQTVIKSGPDGISAYGLGWEIESADGRVKVSHGGDFGNGISTIAELWPSEHLGIAILTNSFPEGHILHAALLKKLEELYFSGKSDTDWWPVVEEKFKQAAAGSILDPYEHLPAVPEQRVVARNAEVYRGEYENDYYGTIHIKPAEKHGLLLIFGNTPEPLSLEHWDKDTFREQETNTGVIFTVDDGGRPDAVKVKLFDFKGRNPVFVRRG